MDQGITLVATLILSMILLVEDNVIWQPPHLFLLYIEKVKFKSMNIQTLISLWSLSLSLSLWLPYLPLPLPPFIFLREDRSYYLQTLKSEQYFFFVSSESQDIIKSSTINLLRTHLLTMLRQLSTNLAAPYKIQLITKLKHMFSE